MNDFIHSSALLFLVLIALQLADVITGLIKVSRSGTFSKKKLKVGILGKFSDWGFIIIGFAVAHVVVLLGERLGMNFKLAEILGWLMFAASLYKECRSVFENLEEFGVPIPGLFKRVLLLVGQQVDGVLALPNDSSGMTLRMNRSLDDLEKRDSINVKIKKPE